MSCLATTVGQLRLGLEKTKFEVYGKPGAPGGYRLQKRKEEQS